MGLDRYLAIAYFQQGVSNFLLGDFEEALANFNDTLLYLRGNTSIDYEQLGLKFRLYSCEVLFNRGLCYVYLRQMGPGLQDLEYAAKEKVTSDHDVIDDAIRENAEVCPFHQCIELRLMSPGIYGVFNTRGSLVSSQRRQSQEPQDQGLPGQVPDHRSIGPQPKCRKPVETYGH